MTKTCQNLTFSNRQSSSPGNKTLYKAYQYLYLDRRNVLEEFYLVIDEIIFISSAARTLGMHPQTLRKYERIGLVRPSRTVGSMRVYSQREIDRLRMIKRLVDGLGINLAGVQQLLSIAEIIEKVRPLVANDGIARPERRRRVARELDRISQLLGL